MSFADPYDAVRIVPVLKQDRKKFIARMQAFRADSIDARVLRTYLMSQVICRVQTEAAARECNLMKDHEDLDAQNVQNLSAFNFDFANLKAVVAGLVGVLEASQSFLSEEAVLQARDVMVAAGQALVASSEGEVSADTLLEVFAKQKNLLQELAENQSLQIYSPIMSQILQWLQAKPQGLPARSLYPQQKVGKENSKDPYSKHGGVFCFLSSQGRFHCANHLLELDLGPELKKSGYVKLTSESYSWGSCLENREGKVVCTLGYYEDSMPTREVPSCQGRSLNISESGNIRVYVKSATNYESGVSGNISEFKDWKNAVWAAEVVCAERAQIRYLSENYMRTVDRVITPPIFERVAQLNLPEGAHDLTRVYDRYYFLDKEGTLHLDPRPSHSENQEFAGDLHPRGIKKLISLQGELCAFYDGPGWTCLDVRRHDSYQKKYYEINKVFVGQAEPMNFESGFLSATEIIFVGKGQVRRIARPAGSSGYYFTSYYARSGWSDSHYEDVVCYMLGGKSQCRAMRDGQLVDPKLYTPKKTYRNPVLVSSEYRYRESVRCDFVGGSLDCPSDYGNVKVTLPAALRIPLERITSTAQGLCVISGPQKVTCVDRYSDGRREYQVPLKPQERIRKIFSNGDLCVEADSEVKCFVAVAPGSESKKDFTPYFETRALITREESRAKR